MLLVRKDADGAFTAGVTGFVAIYSAIGLRDEALNAALGDLLKGGPPQWMSITRLRRDAHERSASCRLHGERVCVSA